jgi:hypothetical protein
LAWVLVLAWEWALVLASAQESVWEWASVSGLAWELGSASVLGSARAPDPQPLRSAL